MQVHCTVNVTHSNEDDLFRLPSVNPPNRSTLPPSARLAVATPESGSVPDTHSCSRRSWTATSMRAGSLSAIRPAWYRLHNAGTVTEVTGRKGGCYTMSNQGASFICTCYLPPPVVTALTFCSSNSQTQQTL